MWLVRIFAVAWIATGSSEFVPVRDMTAPTLARLRYAHNAHIGTVRRCRSAVAQCEPSYPLSLSVNVRP